MSSRSCYLGQVWISKASYEANCCRLSGVNDVVERGCRNVVIVVSYEYSDCGR